MGVQESAYWSTSTRVRLGSSAIWEKASLTELEFVESNSFKSFNSLIPPAFSSDNRLRFIDPKSCFYPAPPNDSCRHLRCRRHFDPVAPSSGHRLMPKQRASSAMTSIPLAFRMLFESPGRLLLRPPESAGPRPDDDRDWWRELVARTMEAAQYQITPVRRLLRHCLPDIRWPGCLGTFPGCFSHSDRALPLGVSPGNHFKF